MAHITTLTRAYNDLHNSQANTYSYSGSFETFKESEVKVTKNDSNVITTLTYNSSPSDNTQYSVNLTDKTIHVGGANLTSGTLSIFPETDLGDPTLKAPYSAGSAITASDITNNQLQVMRRQMEFDEKKLDNNGGTMTGDLAMGEDTKIIFEGATDNNFETTITVADPTSDKTITFPDTTGTVVTTGDTGTVATGMIAADAITGAKIADDQINSEHYVDDSIDTAHIADSQITSAKIADGTIVAGDLASNAITTVKITDSNITTAKIADSNITTAKIADSNVTTAKIAADAVNGTKIADDSINSEHYVDGSIDTVHIADNQITTAKIASNAVTTVKITDANVTTAKIADSNVTTAKIAADAIDGTKIADNSINSEHYVDGSIDVEHLADNSVDGASIVADAVDGTKIADDSINSEHYVDGSIDTAHIADAQITTAKIVDANVTQAKLAANAVATANITDNQVTTAKLVDGSVTNPKIADDAINSEHYADLSINTAHLNNNSVTTPKIENANVTDAKLASNSVITSKITDANVTTVKVADANITLAKLASDLKQTSISNSDTQLPTSGAVVDYVAAQLLPFGGFEAVATEVAFPNTQPASGVIISISDAAGVVIAQEGGTSNYRSQTGRTVGGSTVTINGFPSSLNGETLASGVGLMVSSTGSSQIYNYHKILAAETDVKQLSDDINDFNARYRVGSSNPTSALDGGDLFFNTGSSKLLVYNNTSSAWEEAQSIGQYFINTISSYSGTGGNSASFNGAAYRFVLSNPGTVAEQHIVSINGVIQKPNSGTSQPSEGFAIDGSSIIFSSAPASSADFFIITIGSTVNIGTPSDGTVSTSKLASGAVTTAKIADNSVTAAKLADVGAIDNTNQLGTNVVTTVKIADDAVTADKLANSINSEIAANTAKTTNATHTGEVTGGTALTIADNVVDEANLKVSNSPSNGYFLSAQSGNTGGLTWAQVTTDLVGDTSPELGGNLDCNDKNILLNDSSGSANNRIRLGASQDFALFHNGTINIIEAVSGDLHLRLNGSEEGIIAKQNGAVEVYNDNVKRFETTSDGVQIYGLDNGESGARGDFKFKQVDGTSKIMFDASAAQFEFLDNSKATFGSGDDLQIYHDGSHSILKNVTGYLRLAAGGSGVTINNADNTETMAAFIKDGAVDLYYDGSKKLETISGGISVTGGINTSAASTFNQSNFNSGAGAATIAANSDIRFTNGTWTGNAVKIQHHDNVLYVGIGSNGIIFREDATGRWKIDGSGHFSPEANNTYDIGSTSQRVRNIYTNDLHLSNEGHSNDVDGTWGNWTIQEGESDLFLKNNRSGKKYKFNLTEVS